MPVATAATQDGALRMETITAYNLVVDSNIETPAGKSPSAAHMGVRITNTGAVPLTNVVVNIGNMTSPGVGTPGVFAERTPTVLETGGLYSGTFKLQMPSGPADAVRVIPSIAPGETVVQYFFITYPLLDGSGNSVAGAASVPEDDLWLNYDIWASANNGALQVDQRTKVTMRNEISAMANKIWPNGSNKVPDEYLNAIQSVVGWRPEAGVTRVPGAVVMEGIWYDLGNVGAGFDNNLDGIPDRNAWMQPVGDPSKFSALAARMVKCYGIVIVKLNDGTEQLIPFEDQLYFENIPANNTGAVGLVFYEFIPLDLTRPALLSPYQEVASGYDNEKFNSDYGASVGSVSGTPPIVAFDKTGPVDIAGGGTATYILSATNNEPVNSSKVFGWPDLSLPLVFQDTIPTGLVYVAGSATAANSPPSGQTYTVYFSTDSGANWVTSPVPEPAAASITTIRWILSGSIARTQTAAVQFQATVPSNYVGASVENTACLRTGTETNFACDTTTTRVTGINSLGDYIWRDLDRDGTQNDGLASVVGIANIGVSLYVDTDGDGVLDTGEPLYGTTTTNSSGAYLFSTLPDRKYIVVVDSLDADLPYGFTLKAGVSDRIAVDLDSAGASATAVDVLTADWPFIAGLEVTKAVSPTIYNEGDLITYDVHLDNHMSTLVLPQPNVQTIYASATDFDQAQAEAYASRTQAAGAPNNLFTYLDWNANSDNLFSTGVTPSFTLPGGANITKVELIVRGYMPARFVETGLQTQIEIGHSDRTLDFTGIPNVGIVGSQGIVSNAAMNALVGVPQDLVIDITAASGVTPGWTAAEINSLSAALNADKAGGPGGDGDYYVDSIGFRITTDNTPSSGSSGPNTISQWPLKDTYDPAKLQFVSASITPDLTAPAGTLEWYNLGPVNAGARKSFTVTFRALAPTDTVAPVGNRDAMTANNLVSTQGSSQGFVPYFQSGRAAGHDDGTVNVTINPAGRIGDFVYWDIDRSTAFNAGDIPLAGVYLKLFLGGVDTGRVAVTNSQGYYEFGGLADGTYSVRIIVDKASSLYSLPWVVPGNNNAFVVSTQRGSTQSVDTNSYDSADIGEFVQGDSVVLNNTDTVTTNDNNFLQDFGFDTNTASLISGKLFRDWDGDGFQDPGDEPLVGFTVTLTGANARTTTTDANGFYQFTNLTTAGDSTVTVTPPADHTQTLDPDLLPPGTLGGNNTTIVNVVLGNSYINRDFAYRPSGSLTLGDTVYYDWNGNGSQNAGEGGIANITVNLYEDSDGDGMIDSGDAIMATTTTNASGFYQFTGLSAVADDYIVQVDTADSDFPATFLQTQDFDGLFNNLAEVPFTASIDTVDFGYQPVGTGSIGNLIWLDADNDGIKDASESGINGVTVQLFRSDQTPGVSTPYATMTTSGGGLYSFANLPEGSYTVYLPASNFTGGGALVNTPLSSTTTVTADNAVDNDDNGSQSGGAGTAVSSPTIILGAAETDNTKDFGFLGVGSVGDFVFYDSNGNGSQDFSETGIAGVTVRIYLDPDNDGDPDGAEVANTTTADGTGLDPAGYYRFNNLPPGTYFVQVDTGTLPVGVTYTADPDRDGVPVGTAPLTPAGDNADSLVIVASGSNYSGADFGYKPPGAIGDFVWLDLDQDGVQDSGEPGIAGVTVEIRDATTDALISTVITDLDGYWSKILVDGSYKVVIPTSNFNPGGPLENRATTYDADGIATANTATITIASGLVTVPAALPEGNLGIDFGYKLNGNYGLSGTIAIHDTGAIGTADDVDDFYEDGVDMDAGPDDEVELSGVEVFLYTNGGDFLGSTFTDANGDYAFSGLPGNTSYRVIIGTTAPPLDYSTLTTTTINNRSGSTVTSTSTSVTQLVPIGTSSVENVDFTFNSSVTFDFGDLPSLYSSTTLAQNGARHIIPGGGSTLYLGTAPDADTNGLPSSLANGDDIFGSDDEDGVTPFSISSWVDGAGGGSVQVAVTGSGWLTGWIDWNHDGDLLDPGEFVISQAVTTGTSTISFAIPAATIGATTESWLSRFRIFPTRPGYPQFSYEGNATSGEVEDHLFERLVDGSIGDIVWIDLDGDGVKDSNEEGIGGITVQAFDGTNTVSQITGTGSNDVDGDGVIDPVGYYRFRGLAANTYTITVTTPPTGYTASYDENSGTVSPDGITQVGLLANVQHLSADFGYRPLLADISGTVYFDTIVNSTIDAPGDATAGFVRVQLFTDPNGDGDPSDGVQIRETFTNTSGYYEFVDVPTGKYVVVEVNPPGATSVYDVVGSLTDDRIPVTMVGSDVTGRNFLDTQPALYSVAGTVYDDSAANSNLIDVSDAPVAGVTVNLYIDRDGNGVFTTGDTLRATTTTNSTGDYSFSGLYPGDYVVEKINPVGGLTNDWDALAPLNDSQIGVTIVAANIVDRDFLIDGYHVAIGDYAWIDTDLDGQQDGGETGLDGVTVSLYRPGFGPDGIAGNGDDTTAVATTTTAGGGFYSFTGQPPGTYQVNFGVPSAYGRIVPDQGADETDSDANEATGNTANIVLAAGATNTTIDAGYYSCQNDWTAWKAQHPTELPGGNPDADNYDNFAEFAFHMPYDSGETGVHLPEGDAWIVRPSTMNPDILEGVFVRPVDAPLNTTYILQYAAQGTLGNPTVWLEKVIPSVDVAITTVNNGDCTETVTIVNLHTATGYDPRGLVRIKAVLDDDGVGNDQDHTSYTEPEGWTRTVCGTCCSTYNVPYQREAEFTGTVATVNGLALEFAGENFQSYLAPGASYYVEVTNGANEGQRFDVASASGNAITLVSDSNLHAAIGPFNTLNGAPPPSVEALKVILRRHWTLNDVFPPNEFEATNTNNTADQVQIYSGGAWQIYWLYDENGAAAPLPRWVEVGDSGNADKGGVIIPPGQGMFFYNRTTGSENTLLAYGEVRRNNFVRPLAVGNNLVGGGYPVDQSPNGAGGRNMNIPIGFFGSTDFKQADSIFIWKADSTADAQGYDTYFQLDGAPKNPSAIRWVKHGINSSTSFDDTTLLLSNRATLVRTKDGLNGHTHPKPWSP